MGVELKPMVSTPVPRQLTDLDYEIIKLPKLYRAACFKKIDSECMVAGISEKRMLRDILSNYLSGHKDAVEKGIGIMVYGPNGCGKTAALCWLLKSLRRLRHSALFISGSQMVDIKINDSELWDRMNQVDFLLLDDFQRVHSTKENTSSVFALETLDMLLRSRVQNLKPTLFSSNVRTRDLVSGGHVLQGTLSLLKESVIVVEAYGEDKRKKKGEFLASWIHQNHSVK